MSFRVTENRLLLAFGLVCFVLGGWLRVEYALGHHHPRHNASSDAGDYLERAQDLLARGADRDISDTIWPPGTSALWAAWSAIDASQELSALGNALASVAVVLLTAACAALLAGWRAGLLALALASLHPGFIHYAGFFLAEQPFGLAVALALFLSFSALIERERRAELEPKHSRLAGLWPGVICGAAWGLAALFRPNAVPVLGIGGAALALWSWRRRETKLIGLGVGVVVGLLLVLAPAAHRCSSVAGGRFCVVSNNITMNLALGQAGKVYGLEFIDPTRPSESTGWVPPALLHHGYQGMGRVPATIYDTPGVLRWVAARFAEDPGMFAVRALGNALDLFGFEYWPGNYGRWPERAVTVWKQLFAACVLLPALVGLAHWVRELWRGGVVRPAPLLVIGCLLGLFVSAAFSLGEARYRIPFDVVLIALASVVYTRSHASALTALPSAVNTGRLSERRWLPWASVVLACSLGIVVVTHPGLHDGPLLPQRDAVFDWPWRTSRIERGALEFASPRAPGSDWAAQGNYVWQCNPRCAELRLRFAGPQHGRRVSLSLDHNDRYRVLFYRGESLVGRADLGFGSGPPGLHVQQIDVPLTAAGFDRLGVRPLYGDGRYSLGHLAAY